MGGIGNHSHQQEAASTYRSHHQERGCRLGEIAQSREGDAEDGREHDCLEKIVAHQGYQRDDAQIAKHQSDADYATHGTDEEHGGCLDMADGGHEPRREKTQRANRRRDRRSGNACRKRIIRHRFTAFSFFLQAKDFTKRCVLC